MSNWLHPGIHCVFFDAVGTLIFPQPGAVDVYAQAARRRGLDLDRDMIRERLWAAYRAEEAVDRAAGWITSEERERERWQRIVTDSLPGVTDLEGCFSELFEHFSLPDAWTVNSDAERVFSALQQRGITLGLASNYDSRLLSVIAGHTVLALIRDRVVVSATVGYRKPAPEFFREVVRTAGCEPEEILFVGDDIENDYEGATASGLNAILLDPSRTPDERRTHIENRMTSLADLIRG